VTLLDPARRVGTTFGVAASPALLVRTLPALSVVLALIVSATGPAAADTPPGVWPLDPRPAVVRGFDPPDVRWGSGHRGVDLAGRVGQPVHAALAGTVAFAGRVAGRGVVVVDHGATRTTYQPVVASVSRGDVVGRGEVIGTLAWFGTHCLPAACLHWGLVRGETYLDPLSLIGGPRPVRLLPLDGFPPFGSLAGRPVAPRFVPSARTGTPVVLLGPALAAMAGAALLPRSG
jgi:murein DD-endopeptidase MepM/ murein hydrolase activator NlpD